MKSLLKTLLFALSLNVFGAEEKLLKLDEVLSVVRTNMTDISAEELSNSAALGLIKVLGTKVQLVEDGATNLTATAEFPDPISKVTVYQEKFGYIRIKSVDEGLTNEFRRRLTQLMASNRLSGLVIDLRYAQGTNYHAAAAVADEFVRGGEPLVKLGNEQVSAQDRASDVRQPVAVLVNGETRAAAEALAGILRESAAALVIGSPTAGEARLYEIFTLSTGHKLRVGKVPVVVGSGKTIPATGITPDIEVKVSPEEEMAFYQNPCRERRLFGAGGGTNDFASFIQGRPINEAELVRRHREGLEGLEGAETEVPGPRATPEVAVITDPTLARALDFLKGVSILQPRR